MNLYEFRGIYKPKYTKPFVGILDELEYKFSHISEAFTIVRSSIERNIYSNPKEWKGDLVESNNPRLNIYIAINNVAYNHLQSGKYHVFRGEIAGYGPGEGLFELYEFSAKGLVKMGFWTKKDYKEFNENLKKAIATVG